MKYDTDHLARTQNFEKEVLEKLCRISDILEESYKDPLLKKRLSLIGGTAFNLVHCEDIPRLSVDLDFNYRHVNGEDWSEVRDRIDYRLKKIMNSMEYKNLAINASYPLVRITASYTSQQKHGNEFKLEIGYMRRFPLLKEDKAGKLFHIGKEEKIEVLTPKKEELFGGKLIAALSRKSPRDIFDLAKMPMLEFDQNLLRKCAILESFANENIRIDDLNPNQIFQSVNIDTALTNLLRNDLVKSLDFEELKIQAANLVRRLVNGITPDEKKAIENFYEKGKFKPNLIIIEESFHEKIENYPTIQWTLQKLRRNKKIK